MENYINVQICELVAIFHQSIIRSLSCFLSFSVFISMPVYSFLRGVAGRAVK